MGNKALQQRAWLRCFQPLAVAGGIAGSTVGETIYEGGKAILKTAGNVAKSIVTGVGNVVSSAVSWVGNTLSSAFSWW